VAHAGRRKIIAAGGEEVAHVESSLEHRSRSVNIFARMHESAHGPPDSPARSDTPRVAFQGELGAFSELAIRQHWPTGAISVPCRTFPQAIACVLSYDAEFAVIPIENAIAGVVRAGRDAIARAGDLIAQRSEVRVPIHLCLLAPPGASLAGLRTVRSHPVALAQCRIFFARHGWLEPTAHEDTAGAARDVGARGDRTEGAVAAEAAATRYGLEIIARDVEDVPANWTRFVVVSARSEGP